MSFASWGEIMIQFDLNLPIQYVLSYTSYILFRKYVKDTAADATAADDMRFGMLTSCFDDMRGQHLPVDLQADFARTKSIGNYR